MQNNIQTYGQQTLAFGEDVSTSLQAVSRASRSASRANARAQRMNATSGPQCSELFGLFDPVGSWARTFSELLIGRTGWYSSRCVLTWKRKDMRFSRSLYQLRASGAITCGLGCGLLPTPTASDFQRLRFTEEQLRKSKYQQNIGCLHLRLLSLTTFGQNRINTGLLMGYPKDWTNVPLKPTETQ